MFIFSKPNGMCGSFEDPDLNNSAVHIHTIFEIMKFEHTWLLDSNELC